MSCCYRYIRIPLIIHFFATDDRIHALKHEKLQQILSSVLFEPGRSLQAGLSTEEAMPTEVPTTNSALLGTVYGLLLNELQRSPVGFIDSCITLLKQALDLDTGTVLTSTRNLVLYVKSGLLFWGLINFFSI
jgi:hypothetical protein